MPGLCLTFGAHGRFELAISSGERGVDLMGDDGFLTAVIVSLFTDRRAAGDDPLPELRPGVKSDRRGWWGEQLSQDDSEEPIGSRLWLLWREKDQASAVSRAQVYAEEALSWLTTEAAGRLKTEKLKVTASRQGQGYLGILVEAVRATARGQARAAWNFLYDYENAKPVKAVNIA